MRPDELVELFDPVGAAVSHGFTTIILHGNGQDDRDGNTEFFAYLEEQQIGAAGRAADPGYRARGLLLFRRDHFANPVLGLVDAGLSVRKPGGRPAVSVGAMSGHDQDAVARRGPLGSVGRNEIRSGQPESLERGSAV